MQSNQAARFSALAMLVFALSALFVAGCEETKEALESDVTGQVLDNRGEPVGSATVRSYGLLDNTDFVEGSDIGSAEAYIDREAVLASSNTVATARTGDDGRFRIGAIPNAFLAVAFKEGCSAGFAGFDEETGVLNVDTLITPNIEDGLDFEIETFVLACATPPDVGPNGAGPDAAAFEPPASTVTCDDGACQEAGGSCVDGACSITCFVETCEQAGGTCVDGSCEMPACDEVACEAAGGTCSGDSNSCELPACSSDEQCASGQPGAFCENPGDVALAACRAPLPGEVTAPIEVFGWTGFRVTDATGQLLADAGAGNQAVETAALPSDRTVRVYGDYAGESTVAYVQVQSGGGACANFPPRTDYLAVDLIDGKLVTDKGDYLELALHGGFQRLQLSTSDVLGAGERSFVVEFGEPCAPPAHAFSASLTWDAGPGQPADLDLNVWNAAGELLFVGSKQAAWGQLRDSKGPGPEVFESDDVSQGPFTFKVQFFSGKPRDVQAKVRILRTVEGQLRDETYVIGVGRPKDVAEVGVFAAE